MFAPGNIANYYHRQFWKRCRQTSLDELHQAISCGAQATVTPGFKQRNSKVANGADLMVALTFGEGAMLKDGGTLDCMTKFLQRHAGESAHVDLHTMQVYSPRPHRNFPWNDSKRQSRRTDKKAGFYD